METKVTVREATNADHEFIFELSPALAQVAKLSWHSDEDVQTMQDNYIAEMLKSTDQPTITLLAEYEGKSLGFVHARTHKDGISGEIAGTVPLLAVSNEAQGFGIGKLLMLEAEQWAKSMGCRLLHLEVFANNDNAKGFYHNLGFQPEMLHMIKTI